jgi:hypothetical protein
MFEKDSKKGSKWKLLYHKTSGEDQELDGRMWFRGMRYHCWGQEVGGEELRIEMNGGIL